MQLNVQIYVRANHEQYAKFNDIVVDPKIYKRAKYEHGSSISIREDLGSFLNDEEADKNIMEWFLKSFELMKDLMLQNPQLEWNVEFIS